MRKLVSIQKVLDIKSIEGADAIEVAKVLGWSVVVKKNEFKVGDMVVYAEIDSVFPDKPEFEFLRPRKFRIKTMKLRGQVSQGICFPLDILPDGEYVEDQEVTDILEVVKFEPPIPKELQGLVKGTFPEFLVKTDETRVQVLQRQLTESKGDVYVVTEKLDGTSTTFYLHNDEFGVCSRNLDLLETEGNLYWKMARKYDIEEKLRKLGRNIALQGETIGEGIQSNKYKLQGHEFHVFNIFDIDKHGYVNPEEFNAIVKELGLNAVPVLDDVFIMHDKIDELVEYAKGFSVLNNKTKREGVVIKLRDHETGEGHSFKSINPEFLLKYGDD
ncbi:RNA ligase (ATP) [Rossellomorea marisflavi]|uniref:RNA ligase (ATP) n=1 Tax=Rossellomorea marisflavi TaxID=189381 RepID=UPI003FA0D2BA